MTIRLYSTETREKEALSPLTPGRISMYVCGPTVYDSCHIGHARPAVVFDSIRRHLERSGLAVAFISNITDIDDKIIARSAELGLPWNVLAGRCLDEYERDMAALGVRSPSIRPRATEHIAEMLDLIAGLMDKGHAYVTGKGVWFDVSTFRGYGRLSGRCRDDEHTEHRVEQDAEKRNPQDFALWKAAKPGEPSWSSPWGPGRPGWHIECSAMAGKYCGFQLDIHGGGADLAFPHHENELAQSEALTGRRFARHWLHNGFITIGGPAGDGGKDGGEDGEKMGKSRGNAFRLRDAFQLAAPAALRFWILGTHYRMPLLYRPELLAQAENALDRLYNRLEEAEGALEGVPPSESASGGLAAEAEETAKRFREAMDDDFNTPQALAALHDGVGRLGSGLRNSAPPGQMRSALNAVTGMLDVLGLPTERPIRNSGGQDGVIDLLLEVRNEARGEKNFPLSDRIRNGLNRLGIEIKDRADGSVWSRKRQTD